MIQLLLQEHFYLETQATIAVPKGEDGEMELFVSTQNPTLTQVRNSCSAGLKVNFNPTLNLVRATLQSVLILFLFYSNPQKLAAKALGVPANRIVVRVKRMGETFS